MPRSDQSEQSVDELLADVERLTDDDVERTETGASVASETAESTAATGRLGRLFSPKTFLVALVLSVIAVVAGGAIPLVGFVGRLVGLFAVAFALGLIGSDRRYLEVALAGALASGLGFVASSLTAAFFPFALDLLAEYGVGIAGVGAGVGALVSLVGHYVGRDLRDGLTREL